MHCGIFCAQGLGLPGALCESEMLSCMICGLWFIVCDLWEFTVLVKEGGG